MPILRRFLLVLGVFSTASVWAMDRNVPADFPSIQSALDAALDGDRVVVAPGRYYEVLRFPARNIHMTSSAGPALTTIDAQQNGTVMTFEGAPGRGAILEGFTLTNGLGSVGSKGGGVQMGQGASAVVRGNVIRQNRGSGNGDGVSMEYPLSPLIEGNDIHHNGSGPGWSSGGGGGIGVRGSACFSTSNCGVEILNNYIGNNYSTTHSSGGGIYFDGARAAVISNVIEYNTASGRGGGLSSVSGGPVRVENNLFHANWVVESGGSGGSGGGIYLIACPDCADHVIVNNTFVANEAFTGSAIKTMSYGGEIRIANNLISAVGNGSAVYCDTGATPSTRNNIVHVPYGTAYAGLCAAMSGLNGNQTAAPVFAGEFDFRLQVGSPGVDEGVNTESSQTVDLTGKTRIADGDGDGDPIIDVGAYELPPPTIFADGFEATP